jgi:hypothetical protein
MKVNGDDTFAEDYFKEFAHDNDGANSFVSITENYQNFSNSTIQTQLLKSGNFYK